ncbi:MAG: hypothetical protein WCK71_01105 [bacterium]
MNASHQPKPITDSTSVSDGDDQLSQEEIYPQAESAIGRAQRVAQRWDYENFPDGKIPYC